MGLFGPDKSEKVERAVKALASFDERTAAEAAAYLQKHLDDAWPSLEEELRDDSVAARPRVILTLRFCGPLLGRPLVAAAAGPAAVRLAACGVPAGEQVAADTLEALGPSLLPGLVAELGDGGPGVEAAVKVLGRRFPDELAAYCCAASQPKELRHWLAALKLVGPAAKPGLAWVTRLLAPADDTAKVQKQALYAAAAIGPDPGLVPAAAALLTRYPAAATEALCAAGPEGFEALAQGLAAFDEVAGRSVLDLLKGKGSAAQPAAPAVAALVRAVPSLTEAGLKTLVAISPSDACLDVAAAALDDHPALAVDVLLRLGKPGQECLAAHADELGGTEMRTVMRNLVDPTPFLPRIVAMLGVGGDAARDAIEAVAKTGQAALAFAPQIVDAFAAAPNVNLALLMARLADPSFFDPLIRYVYATHGWRMDGRRVDAEAMATFAATTTLDPATIRDAIDAADYEITGERTGDWVDTTRGDRALDGLVADHAPAVGNILHLVADIQDVTERLQSGCSNYAVMQSELVSFAKRRERAARALAERGDPSYDPRLYLR